MNESLENKDQATTVSAPEIVCGGCATSIKKAFENVEGVAAVEVDITRRQVTVKHDRSVAREKILDVLDRAGFSAT